MGAPIKPLERRTVHQIQSGQVIVDLCSVAKELLENSLDAGASSIEVRFKNHGLESIEVQDNGSGIASNNFENVALKHYTSKLANYDDLTSLETFGFRGEALSSLCALSTLHIITSRADQAPKGTKLEFDTSGKLKSTALTASQRGTTVSVEDLFLHLPVRRRELEKNIKREYGKVLRLLQAYACISTDARIVVSNTMAKGKKAVVFATKSKSTTRENIAGIFGVKALHVLATMDLQLDLESTSNLNPRTDDKRVLFSGFVSKPFHGEGRNAPDRQMFFVNGRPCNLPQVAKVFNEVYKSYNVSQSPFIFANIALDLHAYDVNVSPDKRTIMLHDQTNMLESLRTSLTTLFEEQDERISHMQNVFDKPPTIQKTLIKQKGSKDAHSSTPMNEHLPGALGSGNSRWTDDQGRGNLAISGGLVAEPQIPNESSHETRVFSDDKHSNFQKVKPSQSVKEELSKSVDSHQFTQIPTDPLKESSSPLENSDEGLGEQQICGDSAVNPDNLANSNHLESQSKAESSKTYSRTSPDIILNAVEHIRSRRQSPQAATITIGTRTRSAVLGGPPLERSMIDRQSPASSTGGHSLESERSAGEISQQTQNPPAPRSRAGDAPAQKQITFDTEDEVSTSQETSTMGSLIGKRRWNMSKHAATEEVEHNYRKMESQPNDVYIEEQSDSEAKRAREEAKVAELIRRAEEVNVNPILDKKKRASRMLKSPRERDSTVGLIQSLNLPFERINQEANLSHSALSSSTNHSSSLLDLAAPKKAISSDDQITLAISKRDFHDMHVIGQFNLGFILATRNDMDLLIIDQHASDEKYNFERLQKSTTLQNQRLVHPRALELTAFDEEIILDNENALLKNGFQIEVDQSGFKPVGQRCQLLSLPMSREVTFDLSDLEELIALLAEYSPAEFSKHVPRPSKVRRMFAMRACRSSIMIGRTLTLSQMQGLVRHMGEIDRPWNCPHGRPTMRHICGLSDWIAWKEGTGLRGLEEEQLDSVDWTSWIDSVVE